MEKSQAIQIMSALAQPTRIRVFAEIAKAGAVPMAAGAIAEAVDIPANTLSAHLAILSRAGVVTSLREGRRIFYAVSADPVIEVTKFLAALVSSDADSRDEQHYET